MSGAPAVALNHAFDALHAALVVPRNPSIGYNDRLVFQRELTVYAHSSGGMQDLTDAVTRIVGESGVRAGIVQMFNVGSTAAIGALEFELGLTQDLPELLRRLIPPSRDYAHEQTWHDGDAHSHLQATLLGPSLTDGRPVLGAWHRSFTSNATFGLVNGPWPSRWCWANNARHRMAKR